MAPSPSLSPEATDALLRAAWAALARAFGHDVSAPEDVPEEVREQGASFVTLLVGERLVGCIGTLDAYRPLVDDVAANTVAAAFEDPRLPDLRADELDALTVKVSVIGPRRPVPAETRESLEAGLVPGRDGLLLELDGRRATFLPSVWEQVTGPAEFVDLLLQKAGVRPSVWPAGARAWSYRTAEVTSRPG